VHDPEVVRRSSVSSLLASDLRKGGAPYWARNCHLDMEKLPVIASWRAGSSSVWAHCLTATIAGEVGWTVIDANNHEIIVPEIRIGGAWSIKITVVPVAAVGTGVVGIISGQEVDAVRRTGGNALCQEAEACQG
jgi:hypothetical protein